jgi:transcriptional regulator with XRE-family HTH domain
METEKNGGINHLQAWREYRLMSREQLADKVGTTGAVIWHLEQGERALSAKWLRRLAPALGTQPGYLLDNEPNELALEMMDLWANVPDDQRLQVRRVIETFAVRKATA